MNVAKKLKVVADENIPLVSELFKPLGDVVTLAGRNITAADVHDADVLLVRSVTRVDKTLLEGSAVKFVGTCTIGTDHLDKDYMLAKGITFSSAPGCNAYGVVQYVFAALAHLNRLDKKQTVGIVGCGNVGGRLYRSLKAAGFNCVCYDPFLTTEKIPDLQPWEALYQCDVICTHTPLTSSGPYPTQHMMSTDFLNRLKSGALLLNAGRGAVIDNQALLNYFREGNKNAITAVLDVWEPEPTLDTELLEYVSLASPHIAGYSYEGKTNGSLMIFEALAQWLEMDAAQIEKTVSNVKALAYGEPELLQAETLREAILMCHSISEDDARLRAVKNNLSKEFDLLRKHYPKRREFSHYIVVDPVAELLPFYQALGFQVQMTA